jgi:hypothetical protein
MDALFGRGLYETLYWLAVQQSAWYATAFGLAGTLAMGYRLWWGPLLGLLAEVFYVVLGVWTGQPGLWLDAGVWGAVYAGVSWKWWRDLYRPPAVARVPVRPGRARGLSQAVRADGPGRASMAVRRNRPSTLGDQARVLDEALLQQAPTRQASPASLDDLLRLAS